MATVGFIGLGNMGGALAANLVQRGHRVLAHDRAGPERTPAGADMCPDIAEVARGAHVVVLSLPDGTASEKVAREIADTAGRRTAHVVDTSTVGVSAARRVADLLARHGIGHADAPVSGGVAGARARTLTVIYAAPDEVCAAIEPVLADLSERRRRVGERPGLAQAAKLANNFLSATALAATSEALAFGRAAGLDAAVLMDVLNASSGRSGATEDKFPRHVLTGSYDSGFANSLMAKDVALYLGAVAEQGGPDEVGALVGALWRRFADAEPGVDFTRVSPFVEAANKRSEP
ncbi:MULTISPECIES: NAD(P)-dependent oxidoreductase [unclassified Streptomyces]|uniref:NAD(P)-dependent oxidoreductase n=1 Tax=unclassified Streptomyces TaxID=2593676 RepID=UPI00278BDC95|nr:MULTISPECIES: NAD(P)-dependent oxidoreductase [unclassified Streptomyces]